MSNNTDSRGETATKQAVDKRDKKGRFIAGNVPKTGFHTHPERRSNGSWKAETTPRAKLEKLFSETTVGEFLIQVNESNVASNFDERLGDVLISERLASAIIIDSDGKITIKSKEFDSLLYFVYGTKTESDMNITTEKDPVIIKGFILPTAPEDFIDNYGQQKLQA